MSTDEKPTDCGINSLFYELDTGDFYYFNGVWKKVSSKVQLENTGSSGTIEITENGTVDVYDYDYADINVPGVIPTGALPIKENGNVDVTNYATAEVDVDYVTVGFNLPKWEISSPTSLSNARSDLAATSVGNYALFGGGYTGSYTGGVNAYDTSLTRTTPTGLSQARELLAATNVGSYALFGGGQRGNSTKLATVDAYGQTLTRTTPTELSQARRSLAATSIGDYALFGGGSAFSSVVDAYDTSLTRTTPTGLSQARYALAATTVGGYALFAGGGITSSSRTKVVDAYDSSLIRTTPTALSRNSYELAATTVAPVGGSSPQSGYALFGGGSESAVVDAYDTNLTRTTPTGLSRGRSVLAATTVGGYALFGGGMVGSYGRAGVDAYDATLTRTNPTGLSEARGELAATSIGNYALFAGGKTYIYSSGRYQYFSTVDAYTPVSSYNIQLFPDTKYSFNSSTEQISSTMQTITMEPPIVGYIKIKNTTVT